MNQRGINVLSLFDGMSCGQIALERAGIKVNQYFAAEIDKHAIAVTMSNYPNTIQLGDVTKVIAADLPKIDLVIGGSPCQGFSFAGKQLNFEDPRSKLFFEFVRLVEECEPKYFMLENVKMKEEYKQVITDYLLVNPIQINSALVSAQNRVRLYWTNIPGVEQPEDKGILLKDIVHENNECLRPNLIPNFNVNPSGRGMNGDVYSINKEKSRTLTTNKGEGQKISVATEEYIIEEGGKILKIAIPEGTVKGYTEAQVGDGGDLTFINSSTRRGRLMEDKSNCLTAANYDYNIVEELVKYIVPFEKTLQILDKEVQRGKVGYFRQDSQANRVYYIHDKAITLCGDAGGGAAKMGQYLFGCITPDRVEKRQNGQRFNDGRKFYTLTAQDKHGVLIEGYIRKLTPVECERLQTVDDNYTAVASNAQRYKMLGNGWTVDVISHIFKNMEF